LTELTDEAAAALGGSSLTNLWLRGLTDLSPGAARGLAALKAAGNLGPTLRLDSLRSLSPEAAEAFAASNVTYLELIGLKTLSADTARALAAFKGDSLSLAGLVEPPAELARLLPEFRCKTLSLHPWEWNLGRTRPVTSADARLLAAYARRLKKTCVLPGIAGLETPEAVEIARILADAPASFSIPNLRLVSPRTLTVLIRNGNVELPPLDAIELVAEPDGSPTDDFVIPDDFPARGRRR